MIYFRHRGFWPGLTENVSRISFKVFDNLADIFLNNEVDATQTQIEIARKMIILK